MFIVELSHFFGLLSQCTSMGGEWICAPQYVWHWYDRWRYASFQVALNFLHHITSFNKSVYLSIHLCSHWLCLWWSYFKWGCRPIAGAPLDLIPHQGPGPPPEPLGGICPPQRDITLLISFQFSCVWSTLITTHSESCLTCCCCCCCCIPFKPYF